MLISVHKKIILLLILIMGVLSANQNMKIISLAPGYTYQLYKLNRGNSLIANTIYCNTPTPAREKTRVGSIVNVDVEKIYTLQPDLVISSTLTRKNQKKKKKNLGLRVKIFHRPGSFQGIINQYQQLGELVGREALAKSQLDSINQNITYIQSKLKDREKRSIFFQIGTNPLYAANESSFINDLIEMANCQNIVKTTNSGSFSREKIIAKNPEIIFIALNGDKNLHEKQIWQKYKSLRAVKKDQIYPVNPDIFCTPTPFTFSRALEKMVNMLYPDLNLNNE